MIERVPAVGGTRSVPAPDPIARDYLMLALRLDQHRPGLVDAYYGPADLKAVADMESLRDPRRLAEDAVELLGRLPDEVSDPARREYLRAQLVAFETQARDAAGDAIPYETLVARCFDHEMPRLSDAIFHAAADQLDALLPGSQPLGDRLAAWDSTMTIDPDSVPMVADHVASLFRARAADQFGLPDGEKVRIATVRERPWSGYNWYEGGRRSRVEINLDLPVRLGDLIHLVAHETYPGHHLESAIKEAGLVDGAGRTELTLQSVNTPECLLHEGLADLGYRFAVPPADEATLIEELIRVAGLRPATDPSLVRTAAATQVLAGRARRQLRGISGNAALLRHADGYTRAEVVDYLVAVGRRTPERAEQGLDFIDHPLWRTYSFVYREGEQLLARWLEQVPESAWQSRFGQLLGEARSPSSYAAELSPPSGMG